MTDTKNEYEKIASQLAVDCLSYLLSVMLFADKGEDEPMGLG